MNTLNNGMNVYTLGEVMDETIGKIGTPDRDEMECMIASEVADMEKKMHRVSIPDSLYNSLCMRAARSGQSVSSYVRNALASAML